MKKFYTVYVFRFNGFIFKYYYKHIIRYVHRKFITHLIDIEF